MKKNILEKLLTMQLAGLLSLLPVYALADGFGVQKGNSIANYRAGQQSMIASLLHKAQSEGGSAKHKRKQPTASKATSANTTANTTAKLSPALKSAARNAGLSDQAFANMVRNIMPLSPGQIKTLHKMFDQSQRAAATFPGTPPKPTSSSLVINLSPGATPPVIRLSAGYISSLVFVDATGAPWPIQALDVGNPQAFNVKWNKKSNTLLVQALEHYRTANLAVILKGLNTPVMLTLVPGQQVIDYRVDLRVPRIGPNANPVLDGLPATANASLLQVLDGIKPAGSKPLTIMGAQARAWLLDGHIYLRTTLTVLSPSWLATMSSSDGTHAYELQATPIILASERGKIVKLTVKGL